MAHTVVHVKRFKFQDEKQQKQISGCKVTVLEDLNESSDEKGKAVIVANCPYDFFQLFDRLPGSYDLDVSHAPAFGGGLKLLITGVKSASASKA